MTSSKCAWIRKQAQFRGKTLYNPQKSKKYSPNLSVRQDQNASFFSIPDSSIIPKSLTPMAKLRSLDNSLFHDPSPIEMRKYSSQAIIESPVINKSSKSYKIPTFSYKMKESIRKVRLNRSSHFNDSKLSGTQGTKKKSVLKERKVSLGEKKKAKYIPIQILAASEAPGEAPKTTKSRIIRDIKERKHKEALDLDRSRQDSKAYENIKESAGPISSFRSNDIYEGETVSTIKVGSSLQKKAKGDQEVAISINSKIEETDNQEKRRQERSQSPYDYHGTAEMGGLYKKVHREMKKQLMRQSSSQNNMKRDPRAGKIEKVRNYSKNKRFLDNSLQEEKQYRYKYAQNGPHSFGSSRSQSAHRSFFLAKRSPPTRETTRFTNKMESLIQQKAPNMLIDPREGYPYNREQYDLLSSEEGNLTHQIYNHDNAADIDVTQKFHNQSLTNLKSGPIDRSYESKRQNSRRQERPLNISKKVKIEHQKPFGVERTTYQNVNTSLISRRSIKMKKQEKSEERPSLPTLIKENRPVTSVKAQRPRATLLKTTNEGGKRVGLGSQKEIQITQQKKTKQQASPAGVKIVSISKQDEKLKFDSEYELLRKDSSRIAVPTKTLSSMNKVTE